MKEEKLERQKKGGLENFENLPIKKGSILLTSQFFCATKLLIQGIKPCQRGKKASNLLLLHGFCPGQRMPILLSIYPSNPNLPLLLSPRVNYLN